MKNIDCEVYVSQLINFFEKNPNDLMTLIGDLQKEDFYQKLKERCYKNSKEGDDHVITKQQMVDIIIELKMPELTDNVYTQMEVEGIVQKTKWGEIILNYKNLYESGKLITGNPHKLNVIIVPYNVRDTRTIKGDRETISITFDEAEFTISKETLKEDVLIIPKGSIIHFQGIPLRTEQDVIASGNKNNFDEITKERMPNLLKGLPMNIKFYYILF